MQVLVTAEGKAGEVRLYKGLGLGLDERAAQVVRTWRFQPSRDALGRAVPDWVTVEVTFHLY
jgi:TonB family protein